MNISTVYKLQLIWRNYLMQSNLELWPNIWLHNVTNYTRIQTFKSVYFSKKHSSKASYINTKQQNTNTNLCTLHIPQTSCTRKWVQ